VENAYIDGELCALRHDGTTSFSALQAATDTPGAAELVYFAFDLLFIDGTSIAARPLIERKTRLEELLAVLVPLRRPAMAANAGMGGGPSIVTSETRIGPVSIDVHSDDPATAGEAVRRALEREQLTAHSIMGPQ